MKKLSKQQLKTKADLVAKMRDQEESLATAVQRHNEQLRQLNTSLEAAIVAHNDVVGEVREFTYLHGHFRAPAKWRQEWPDGAPRMCFGNALTNAVLEGWNYVEGYALPSIHGKPMNMPVHHGWNTTPEGILVDSAWKNSGWAYCGVEFSVGRADNATWEGDASVLEDWRRSWPLFKDPWLGEPEDAVWNPSEALLLLQEMAHRRRQGLPERDLWCRYLALTLNTLEESATGGS